MKERPGSIFQHETAPIHPDAEMLRIMERLHTGDLHRVRFGRFLERLAPLTGLPPLPEDWGEIDAEEEVNVAWAALIARLRSAMPTELLAYVRERIGWGMDQGKLDEVWSLTQSLKMQPELEAVKRKWTENVYAEYSVAEGVQGKREVLTRFMTRAGQDAVILGEERGMEMCSAYCINQIKELYKFKNKVKSGEAFNFTLGILRKYKIDLRSLDKELFTVVHADAVKRVKAAALDKPHGSDRAKRLIEDFLRIGLLNFDQDEELIEPFTR